MKRILGALAVALCLVGPAAAQEAASPAPAAAPQALPFTFIPKEFQGKWVLTEYQFPPIGPTEPTDPDYFIGKIIEIKNTEVIFFGHACETTRVYLDFHRRDPRFSDFDKRWIPDTDIKVDYPFLLILTVHCQSWRKPLPQGPEALFLNYEDGSGIQVFRLYDPSAGFITTAMSNGPEYIMRPVK